MTIALKKKLKCGVFILAFIFVLGIISHVIPRSRLFILAFLLSSLIGDIFIDFVLDRLWDYAKAQHYCNDRPSALLAMSVGFVERALYMGCFLVEKPQFVVFWLGIKIAVHWKEWHRGRRSIYNIFLLGSGLNIIFGYLAALMANGHFDFLLTQAIPKIPSLLTTVFINDVVSILLAVHIWRRWAKEFPWQGMAYKDVEKPTCTTCIFLREPTTNVKSATCRAAPPNSKGSQDCRWPFVDPNTDWCAHYRSTRDDRSYEEVIRRKK